MTAATEQAGRTSPRCVSDDQISRTAIYIRHDETVHTMTGRWFDSAIGHVYHTGCEMAYHATQGAVLTTVLPNCPDCPSPYRERP